MSSHKVETSDRRDRRKHRNSCSTAEEDLVAATSMDGSTQSAVDALPSCHAISKHPRTAGYRGSDFVHWHIPDNLAGAAKLVRNLGVTCRAGKVLVMRSRRPQMTPQEIFGSVQ